jgi:hypothetical protein
VVYHLLSPRKNQRLRLKCEVDDQTPVPSVVELYPAANGTSGRPTTCTASCSPGTRTCAAS